MVGRRGPSVRVKVQRSWELPWSRGSAPLLLTLQEIFAAGKPAKFWDLFCPGKNSFHRSPGWQAGRDELAGREIGAAQASTTLKIAESGAPQARALCGQAPQRVKARAICRRRTYSEPDTLAKIDGCGAWGPVRCNRLAGRRCKWQRRILFAARWTLLSPSPPICPARGSISGAPTAASAGGKRSRWIAMPQLHCAGELSEGGPLPFTPQPAGTTLRDSILKEMARGRGAIPPLRFGHQVWPPEACRMVSAFGAVYRNSTNSIGAGW